jgi:hypothetical protein
MPMYKVTYYDETSTKRVVLMDEQTFFRWKCRNGYVEAVIVG